MSEQNKITINSLNALILQEAETDSIQEIDSDLYNSISELIKNLKSEECDGIKAKINQAMIKMVTDTTSALLKLRLEKAVLEKSIPLDNEYKLRQSIEDGGKPDKTSKDSLANDESAEQVEMENMKEIDQGEPIPERIDTDTEQE